MGRNPLPDYFETVNVNKAGDVLLTEEQEEYANEEVRRCREGFWIFIKGVKTFIPPKYYFYLQWWKLEDDIYPEYRSTDRRYYLFLSFWEAVMWCLGMVRGKKRREGASSQATANLIYECVFFKNSNCGLISKTLIDSRDTFTDMVGFGYKQLPIFLKPRQVNREESVTEYIFAHKSMKNESGERAVVQEGGGNHSKVNYRAPVLNAYDRGRITRILLDEFGKLENDVDASKLLSIVMKTLVKGVKRVGWADVPSTVNSMTKGGGAQFKIIWDNANQFKKKPTVNRLVRYFTPAYDGYDGFIDQWGESVIDTPTPEQYEYLVAKWVRYNEDGELISELSENDIKLGAKEYVMVKRREGLEGELLEEEIRQNPCNEKEMFMSADVDCTFDAVALATQIEYLEENPPILRTGMFEKDDKGKATFKDTSNGMWHILAFPPAGQENLSHVHRGMKVPSRIDDGVIGVDGYSNSQGGRQYGSKACGLVYRKYNSADPENTGLFLAMFYGRPSTKDILHEQMILASEYYGYEVYYEHTADDYDSFFKSHGRAGYLGRYPTSSIDPAKKGKTTRHKGFPITPFAMTKQVDTGILYIKYHADKIYFLLLLQQFRIFDPNNRTESDCVVAALIALVSQLDTSANRDEAPESPLVKTYGGSWQSAHHQYSEEIIL